MPANKTRKSLSILLLIAVLGFLPSLLSSCSGGSDRRSDDDDDSSGDDDDTGGSASTIEFLLVVDNSNSMAKIQGELQNNFSSVINGLADTGVDYQLGVTTTDMETSGNGNEGNLRNTGPIGSPDCGSIDLVTSSTKDQTGQFAALVDVGVTGSGNEQGLFSAAIALCKSQPESWWANLSSQPEPVQTLCGMVPNSDRLCNAGFLREGSEVVVAIFTDEGDDTERLGFLPPTKTLIECVEKNENDPFFGECDCRLSWWVEIFSSFENPVTFFTVGPTYQWGSETTFLCDGSEVSLPGPCNRFGSTTCSIDFLQEVACLTGGSFSPIEVTGQTDEPSSCSLTDFSEVTSDFLTLVSEL